MAKLVFDIETVGENWDALDETSQHMLTRWIEKESDGEDNYAARLAEVKDGLGFSPLTGSIVAYTTATASVARCFTKQEILQLVDIKNRKKDQSNSNQ